jgi:hypothetical protein
MNRSLLLFFAVALGGIVLRVSQPQAAPSAVTASRRASEQLTPIPKTKVLTQAQLTRGQYVKQGQIVDVRERDEFAQWHIPNSVDIPYSELDVRALIELEIDKPVIVVCSDCGDHPDGGTVGPLCNRASRLLTRKGFGQTYFVTLPPVSNEPDPHATGAQELRAQ